MADFTISSGSYMRIYRTQGADGASLDYGVESTGQSFPRGALLELDVDVSTSSHRLAAATVSASTVTSTSLIGVAGEAASSAVDATRIYWRITPENEFMARTRGGLLAQTNVGTAYGLFYDSTKAVYGVDLANTQSTSLRVVVTGLIDAVGDSGGYVRFKFGLPVGTASTNTFGGGAVPIRY